MGFDSTFASKVALMFSFSGCLLYSSPLHDRADRVILQADAKIPESLEWIDTKRVRRENCRMCSGWAEATRSKDKHWKDGNIIIGITRHMQ